jgi:hypothetical protein
MAAERKSDREPLRSLATFSELHEPAHNKSVRRRFVRGEEQLSDLNAEKAKALVLQAFDTPLNESENGFPRFGASFRFRRGGAWIGKTFNL